MKTTHHSRPREDWTVLRLEKEEASPGYRWLAHNPNLGEGDHYFGTKAQALAFVRARTTIPTGETFAVICRADRLDDEAAGPFVLATRQVFATLEGAQVYARTISPSREAMIIPGLWAHLRPATYPPSIRKETTR